MPALRAIVQGLRRAAASPGLILLLWLANFLVALPAALIVTRAIENDVGASLFHETLRDGFDTAWYAELRTRVGGLAATFDPIRTGGGVVYENLDAFLSGTLFVGEGAVVGFAVLYGALWVLLQGGVLGHLSAGSERLELRRFLADGGRFYGRLLQLALAGLLAYWLLYRAARWLFGGIDDAFRDVGDERQAFLAVLGAGAIFVLALHLVRLVIDFAKIAAVVDDRRFAPLALWQGARYVAARPLRSAGTYFGVGVLSLIFLALYARFAPGPGQSTALAVVLAFALSQLFVAGRIFLRVALFGAELAVYRRTGGL